MTDALERENDNAVAVDTDCAEPLTHLARGLAALPDREPVLASKLRRWLAGRGVRAELSALADRIAAVTTARAVVRLADTDAHRAEVAAATADIVRLARELVQVAYVTGYHAGHDAGEQLGRRAAAGVVQTAELTILERREAEALRTRDANIRGELADLLGVGDRRRGAAPPTWEVILGAVDTMKAAAKMVAHLLGGGGR